jgi:hypothetical protein
MARERACIHLAFRLRKALPNKTNISATCPVGLAERSIMCCDKPCITKQLMTADEQETSIIDAVAAALMWALQGKGK